MSKQKERLQLEFTQKGKRDLALLAEESNALSMHEAVREALRIYGNFLEMTNPQSIVQIIDDGEVSSQFRASLFRNSIV